MRGPTEHPTDGCLRSVNAPSPERGYRPFDLSPSKAGGEVTADFEFGFRSGFNFNFNLNMDINFNLNSEQPAPARGNRLK